MLLFHALTGQGLGLRANQDFMTGDLVFVSRPIGIAYGPQGKIPSNEELTEAILSRVGPSNSSLTSGEAARALWRWIRLLSSPRVATAITEGVGPPQPHHWAADALLEEARYLFQNSAVGFSLSTSPDQHVEVSGMDLISPIAAPSAPDVASAVGCNSYGEAREDVAITELKVCSRHMPQIIVFFVAARFQAEHTVIPSTSQEVQPFSFNGLWPELALVNHSCAPNLSLLVVGGGRMVARAARPVFEGDEVTTSYLGRCGF